MNFLKREGVHIARAIKISFTIKNAVLMVGNSSSGLIEAPSFELPVVNIGDRQRGRVRGKNVIDVPECKKNQLLILYIKHCLLILGIH